MATMQSTANEWFQGVGDWAMKKIKGSAPGQRTVSSAYAQLENAKGEFVGSFLLSIYQLAKKPAGLKHQRFEQALIEAALAKDPDYQFQPEHLLQSRYLSIWKPVIESERFFPQATTREAQKQVMAETVGRLYHKSATGELVAKTPFELAVIQSASRDDIHGFVRNESEWQQAFGLLPQEIFRLRMGEWLGRLDETPYRIRKGGIKEVSVTLDNKRPKKYEEVIHFAMNTIALVTTFAAAVANPMLGLLVGISQFVSFESANIFSTFSTGEWFMKDGRWAMTENFLTTERLSRKHSFFTLAIMGLVGSVAFGAAQMTYASMHSYAFLQAMSPALVQGAFAVCAAWTFATTLIGLTGPILALRGLGFHDNQIAPSEVSNRLRCVDDSPLSKRQRQYEAIRKELHKEGLRTKTEYSPTGQVKVLLVRHQPAELEADNDDRATARPRRRQRNK